jgi:hypothetical protein
MSNPKFDAFWLMPKAERKGVTDSLLLESGREVISARIGGFDFGVRTQGYVTIVWKDVVYNHREDFPNELVEAIRSGNIDSHPDACVNENNWYEMMIWDDDMHLVYSDVIDLDDLTTLTVKEAKEIILDYLDTARECVSN